MQFEVRLKQLGDGSWHARYIGGQVEHLSLRDATREAVLERMQGRHPLPPRVVPLKRRH